MRTTDDGGSNGLESLPNASWAAKRRIQAWLGSTLWRQARFRTASDLYRLAQATENRRLPTAEVIMA